MRVTAVILAAGRGERFGTDHPKQLLKIAGKTVLEHTLEAVQAVDEVDEILVITQEALVGTVRDLVHRCGATKTRAVLIGGETRNDSTRAALAALADRDEGKVLTHDAVRPFVDERIIRDCIEALDEVDAVDVAIRSADTIIRVDGDRIEDIPDRGLLRRGQTPQAFQLTTLREAYHLADVDPEFSASDDCTIVRRYLPDVEIRVVEGSETNIKITHPIDVYLADKLFQLRTLEEIGFDRATLEDGLRDRHIVIVGGSRGIGASIGAMAEGLGAHCHLVSRELTVR
jgi:2-C-methyl-D-erythritol 4-phosphate cytidylyltransferase